MSNEELNKLRKSHKNALHLACSLLSDKIGMMLVRVMLVVWMPCRTFFGQSMHGCAKRKEAIDFDVSLCFSANDDVMYKTTQVLQDRDAISEMRFDEGDDAKYLSEAEVAEADDIAAKAYILMLHVLGSRVTSNMQKSHYVLGLFSSLTTDNAEFRVSSLKRLQTVWEPF